MSNSRPRGKMRSLRGKRTCLTGCKSPDPVLHLLISISTLLRRWSPPPVTLSYILQSRQRKPKCQALSRGSMLVSFLQSFPGTSGKESTCQCRRHKRHEFETWVGKIPWRRKWQPTPVFLPGESHGQRSLAGYGPWGRRDSDMTEAT